MDPDQLRPLFPPCMNCGHLRGSHRDNDPNDLGGCIVTHVGGPPGERYEERCGCTEFVGTP